MMDRWMKQQQSKQCPYCIISLPGVCVSVCVCISKIETKAVFDIKVLHLGHHNIPL